MHSDQDAIEPQLLAALEADEELKAQARARDAAPSPTGGYSSPRTSDLP
jgi:hypothetical protein